MSTVPDDQPGKEQLQRELAFLAEVRRRIRETVGPQVQIPTSAVDHVLDEYNAARAREDDDDPAAP